ncbi:MAG: hypothetical protein IJV27_09085, partial [Prevotella sp.]|nr:hypothetical protein [Prevotella sp.]
NGDVILTFKAGAWNTTNEKTTIDVIVSNTTNNPTKQSQTITLEKAKFKDYSIEITGITQKTKITFTAKQTNNNRFFLDEIKVYSKENIKQEAGISFSSTTAKATIGEEFNAPTFSNPNNLAVTFSSSNEELATVNHNENVSIGQTPGTVKITAQSEETEKFQAGSCGYTLTISQKDTPIPYTYPNCFEWVKDASILKAGDEIIFAYINTASSISMSKTQNTNNRDACLVTYNDDTTISPKEHTAIFTLGGSTGAWTFQDESGYLYAASSSSNYLKSKATIDANAKANISISNSGLASVKFTGTNTHNNLYYNEQYGIFSCYEGSTSNTTKQIRIYRKVDAVDVSISAIGYATLYYSDKALVVPQNLQATTYHVDGLALSESKIYTTGETIPAGTGVVLKGPAGNHTFAISKAEGAKDDKNMLKGSDTEANTEGNGYFYKLAVDINDSKIVGFFWGAEDGGVFKNGAHKAYLVAPSAAAKGFVFENESDKIENNLNSTKKRDNYFYTIEGIRISTHPTQKGIYIHNGKKIIIK